MLEISLQLRIYYFSVKVNTSTSDIYRYLPMLRNGVSRQYLAIQDKKNIYKNKIDEFKGFICFRKFPKVGDS